MSDDRCVKRAYRSVKQARQAHARAGHRIRVYKCFDCGHWHVTANEKRERRYSDEYTRAERS